MGVVLLIVTCAARAGERTQTFDIDPGWEGSNNRILPRSLPTVRQDFGYSATNHAGRSDGEMGGGVTRASKPAWYAKPVEPRTLDDKLTASGSFALTKTSGGSGVFFGFFNSHQRGASGRPIGSLGMNFDGERGGARLALRLITAHNRSCGTFITPFLPGKFRPTPIRNDGTRYTWKLEYDPQAAGGRGRIRFTLHGNAPTPGELEKPGLPESYTEEARRRFPDVTEFSVELPEGFKQQGTRFDRFGLMNMMKPGGTMAVYFDDLEIGGQSQDFAQDPKWDEMGNRATYQASDVVGAQNFGFSETNFAGGKARGELGGIFWRTETPAAFYADRVGPLSLEDSLDARGKIAFTVGAPDSGLFIGWFDAEALRSSKQLRDFVGVRLEGPTRIGHYFAPVCAASDGTLARAESAPVLIPGEKSHTWSIHYDPKSAQLTATLDGKSQTVHLKPRQRTSGAKLDHFGVFPPRVGGSQVKVYLDDITYTAER